MLSWRRSVLALPCWSSRGRACSRVWRSAENSMGSSPASPGALRTRAVDATARISYTSGTRQQKGRGHGRWGCHSVRGTGIGYCEQIAIVSRAVPPELRRNAPRRRQGAGVPSSRCRASWPHGVMWGCACSDFAPKPAPVSCEGERLERRLSTSRSHRIGLQNDPLEGGKIREKNANQRSLKLKACGYSWCN